MFSLIITVISVALVAGLALATLYYGGSAFNKGSARAEASKILLQGQQLLGAAELYFSQNGVWPAGIDVLVDDGYLKAIPSAQASGLAEALAAGSRWQMVPGAPSFYVTTTGSDVCAEVNLAASLHQRGVLKNAYTALPAQCYGDNAFTTVFRKAASTVFPTLPNVVAGSPPADPADPAWKVPPTANQAGSGGTGGTGNTGGTGGDAPPPAPAAQVELTPAQALDFGAVLIGQVQAQPVVLRNTGNADMAIAAAPAVQGDPQFTLASTTCGSSVAAGQQCEMSVTFTPVSLGEASGTLTLTANGTPYALGLTAAGDGLGVLDALPSLLAVGDVAPGATGAVQLQLRNSGTAPLAFVSAPHLASGTSGAMSTSSSCGATLAPSSSCYVTVTVASSVAGNQSGAVLFTLDTVDYSVPVTAYVQSVYWRVNYTLTSAQSTTWYTTKSAACSTFLSAVASANPGYTWTSTNNDTTCSTHGTKATNVWQYAIAGTQPNHKFPWPSPYFDSRELACARVQSSFYEANPTYAYTYTTKVESVDPNRPDSGVCNGYTTAYPPGEVKDSFSFTARQGTATQTVDKAATYESRVQ